MKRLVKDLIIAFKLVLIISVVTVLVNIFVYNGFSWRMLERQIFYNAFYGFPLSLVNRYLFDYLDERWPWGKYTKERTIYGSLGSIIITMLCVLLLNLVLWVWIWGNDYSVLFAPKNRTFYIISLIITVVISATLHAYFFLKQLLVQKEANDKLEKENLKTELSVLRSQVDPHFLFNSFNVLSGLIDEDKENAQEFLSKLSSIYRYVLERRNEDTSTLKEELSFAEEYLRLQEMRFEDSIRLIPNIPSIYLEREIPSLTLQLLLENVVKHNSFSKDNPMEVHIGVEGDQLIVSNKISKRRSNTGSQMGLKNIEDRYLLLANKKIKVLDRDDQFMVKLPLL